MKWHSSLVTHDRSGGVAGCAESHLHVSFSLCVHVGRFSHGVAFTSRSLFAEGESLQVFGLSV